MKFLDQAKIYISSGSGGSSTGSSFLEAAPLELVFLTGAFFTSVSAAGSFVSTACAS